MPASSHRKVMGSIINKVASALHKQANKARRRRRSRRVRAAPATRGRLRDRSPDGVHGATSPRHGHPDRDQPHVSGPYESESYDSSASSTESSEYSFDPSDESPLIERDRYIANNSRNVYQDQYQAGNRGQERQVPERENTRQRDIHHTLPGSHILLPPTGSREESNWPLTTETIPQEGVTLVGNQSQPAERHDDSGGSERGAKTDSDSESDSDTNSELGGEINISEDGDHTSQIRLISTKHDGDSDIDSDRDSGSDSNMSFDEWENPEEYERRLTAKKTKEEKRYGRVMETNESDAGPSMLPASQAEDQSQHNRPVSGASTAPSWLEEVMTPYYNVSDGGGEHTNNDENTSAKRPTKEEVRDGKRPEKPVNLGQIIVEEYRSPSSARSHSIRRKPVGSAPSRKTANVGTIPPLSGSDDPAPGTSTSFSSGDIPRPDLSRTQLPPIQETAPVPSMPNYSRPFRHTSPPPPPPTSPPPPPPPPAIPPPPPPTIPPPPPPPDRQSSCLRGRRRRGRSPKPHNSANVDGGYMQQPPRYNYMWDS
ncbi:hypothetical protein V8F20_011468 [Naviculisporaceae sp. PSN 640]